MDPTSREPLPPPVHVLLDDKAAVRRRYPITRPEKWRISRTPRPLLSRLLHSSRPYTPSASFYRLYEFFVIDWNTQFRNELEYFCREHPEWKISDIPDPEDPDPLRYAVLSVLTKLMCLAFNRRVDYGLPRDAPAIIEDFDEQAARPKLYETTPVWAQRVPPLPERVYIPDAKDENCAEDDDELSEEFKEMNIIVKIPHIHFI